MKLHKILPHINLVLSFMMLVLIVVNYINPMMTFLYGMEFETALATLVAVGLIASVTAIIRNAKCTDDKK